MRAYPVCLVMAGRPAVVVGGGEVAARKVAGLLEAGAIVTVVAPAICLPLRRLADAGRIVLIERPYGSGDLAGAALAIAATDDPVANAAVWADARGCGCLVNVVDDPSHCDFILPAVVRRGDLTVGISTGGASPALARRLRERLEQAIGPEYGALAALLADLRPLLDERCATPAERLACALRLVDSDLIALLRAGEDATARARALSLLPPAPGGEGVFRFEGASGPGGETPPLPVGPQRGTAPGGE